MRTLKGLCERVVMKKATLRIHKSETDVLRAYNGRLDERTKEAEELDKRYKPQKPRSLPQDY
jgi:hypothetical protein